MRMRDVREVEGQLGRERERWRKRGEMRNSDSGVLSSADGP